MLRSWLNSKDSRPKKKHVQKQKKKLSLKQKRKQMMQISMTAMMVVTMMCFRNELDAVIDATGRRCREICGSR